MGDLPIEEAMDGLVRAGLCIRFFSEGRNQPEYACHPVLREACRLSLLRTDSGLIATAVELLTGRPTSDQTKGSEFAAGIDAVVLLLEVRNPVQALGLIQGRLRSGEEFVIRRALPEANDRILGHIMAPENFNILRRTRSSTRLIDTAEVISAAAEATRIAGDVALVTRLYSGVFDEIEDRLDRLDADIPDERFGPKGADAVPKPG